ncbi:MULTISPECIES: hypothetical protein [unclassified Clostridium]|nr:MULTISPECIES: hypothetical protein [unclassified Clostridium]
MKQERLRRITVKRIKKTVDNLRYNRYNSRSHHMMTKQIGL